MARKVTYSGSAVDVTWDGELCVHVGECGRAKGDLFEGGRDPWCDPDQVEANYAAEVTRRCPTGALTYTRRDGGEAERAPDKNTIVVANNGPLYVTGDLQIDGAKPEQTGLSKRAALCRCGNSQNKPFCDNSHEVAHFVDRGAVGDRGPGLPGETRGELTVRRAPNGPLLVAGPCTIVAGTGREAWSGVRAALCRCGHSANKPFCDGAHRAAGFQAD